MYVADVCFVLILYVPVNNFTDMSGHLPGLNLYQAAGKVSCSILTHISLVSFFWDIGK